MDRRLLLAAAALVLLGALVAALAFTGGDADTQPLAYAVEWPVDEGPTTTRNDELEENRNETYRFDLNRSNVTRVRVQLTWEDDVGEPDEFRVRVAPPNGTPATNSSRNGTINLTFELQEPPSLGVVEAHNRSQARLQVADEDEGVGRGAWTVRVTLSDAPGRRPVPGAEDVETEPDGSNSYEVSFGHETFYAELGEARPPDPG
jgi:hypothetical protein